jgi:phytoene synthase
MADVVVRSTQPALAAVKLAWWRERLAELDDGKVPAEPRLQAAAAELLPRGITGGDVAELEEGWAGLLYERPDTASLREHGTLLFKLGSRLLDASFDDSTIGMAGRMYVAVDASRRGIIDLPANVPGAVGATIGKRARPLTALAALAARDLKRGGPPFESEATPGRAWTLLRHRLNGRLG